ncbi:DsrE/DsrF/DrsH-like family protein [Demequina mangrovi]|uniref:Peroxiredoxin family protein n=1 Tax=Demequina mangrovi TaxID=1043493 RepID=A0A1H7AZF0_9MICO|nr:DsrE/DsrF/DrsH-like family protein [Demequina mangrovi]SEJ70949.1 Peroxiredoxin family protein [Demequina mangrovi]
MTDMQAKPAVVPDFGDDDDTDRKLVIICSKGNLDMAYPGLVLANSALGEGIAVDLFFTFWGFDMITRSRQKKLSFTPVGNTAMHLPFGGRMPQWLSPFPGMTWVATRMMRKQIDDLGVPPVDEFLDQIVASGGRLWACQMSADMQKLTMEDLRDDVEGIITAADFMDLSEGAQTLFI